MDLVVHEGVKVFLISDINNFCLLVILFSHLCFFVVEENVNSYTCDCPEYCANSCNNDPGNDLKTSYFGVVAIG